MLPGNVIDSLDFNPSGSTIATLDNFGTCLVSDVSTHKLRFHMKLPENPSGGKQNFQLLLIFNVFNLFYLDPLYLFILLIHSDTKFVYFNNLSLDGFSRCRWGIYSDEPFLFVKCAWRYLEIIDVEKKAYVLKDSFELDGSSKRSLILPLQLDVLT